MQVGATVPAALKNVHAGRLDILLRRLLGLVGLDDDKRARCESAQTGDALRGNKTVAASIGRISEHQGCGWPLPGGDAGRVTGDDLAVARAFQTVDICPEDRQRFHVTLDETCRFRPAGQGFKSQSAGPGESIDDDSVDLEEDDVLEQDDDSTVSLDDLADVARDEDDAS